MDLTKLKKKAVEITVLLLLTIEFVVIMETKFKQCVNQEKNEAHQFLPRKSEEKILS
jgi:hypothetical protein